MALKHSYTLLAPVYDALVAGPLDACRQKSLSRITETADKTILLNGVGSGLDIPYLPGDAIYTASDITPAMINRARKRASKNSSAINISFELADSQDLPFTDDSYDIVIMHLILAVVPKPELALIEACRVLKPGGKIYIFDKFIRPGQLALTRRLLSLFIQHIATRTDVVFEKVLQSCPQLEVKHDEPVLAKGWFRLIELEKKQL